LVRRLDEGNGFRAPGRSALDFGDRGPNVPERNHHQRDLTFGSVAAPFVKDEVVVCADAELREVLVLGLMKCAAGEPAEVREAQLRPHALDIHVLDAVGDVVTPGQHVVVAARVHPEVAWMLARNGIEGKVARLTAFIKPGVVAVGQLDDSRRHVGVLSGYAVEPNPGVLDDMVIYRDDSYVVGKHVISF